MNEETKLVFALEHIAHLEDYIERESPLYHPLTTIKFALEKQLIQILQDSKILLHRLF